MAANRDAGRRLAEADQLGVVARTRGEALRPDMKRLEQIRLPDAVRSHRQHEPGKQVELQLRVGAEVDE